MKNILRTAALVNLMLLYGFVISLYNGSEFFQHSLFTEQRTQPQTESYNSVISKSLFCHTAPTENSVTVVTNVSASSFKNQFTDFTEFIRTTDQVFLAKFLQYSFFSKNIFLRLRQYDIIFPFHYFW